MRDVGHKLAAELLEPRELAYPDALAVEREEDEEHACDSDKRRKDKTCLCAAVWRENAVKRNSKHHLEGPGVFNRPVDVVAVAQDVGEAAEGVEDQPALGLAEDAEPHSVCRALAAERMNGGEVACAQRLLKRRGGNLGPGEQVIPGPLEHRRAESRHLACEDDRHADKTDGGDCGGKPRPKP